ncbi:GNAT family N-acetyltransferase [Kitasatospora azatica]|uniref:GNAT family N-acetyltransferase n=1 Tax=Kitasatospora azatica TaxID=58347 RepID=UPI00055B2BC5|nr:GNAT family N-acetyltransferase [Kitasatospora azatica]
MTDFSVITDPAAWQPDFRRRLIDGYQAAGLPGPAADAHVTKLMEKADEWTAAAILDQGGRRIGQVVVSVTDQQGQGIGRIRELWTDPELDEQDTHRRAAHAWARDWCADRGVDQVMVQLTAPDELFAEYPVRGQVRFKLITTPTETPPGVTQRPLTEAEYADWLARGIEAYTGDILRSGSLEPEQARRKAEEDFQRLLPEGLATPDTALVVLEADGEPIGNAWVRHGHLPGVSYGYDLVVHPEFRGRGLGRAAMAVGEQTVRAAGDRALMFTVWGGNEVAMSLYTAVGFGVLEETRTLVL